MPLSPLPNWEETRDSLQRAALLLNQVQRRIDSQERPFHLQYSLAAHESELRTHPLDVATFALSFDTQTVTVNFAAGGSLTHSLAGSQPTLLAEAITTPLAELGVNIELSIEDDTPFAIDAGLSTDYGTSLDAVYSVMARVRARTIGFWSPLVLWAHHFDLSNMWFLIPNRHDEYKDPHINMGFSPGDETIARPYFYIYGYDADNGYVSEGMLPAPAVWNTDGYTGVRIDYDDFIGHSDALAALEATLLASFNIVVR